MTPAQYFGLLAALGSAPGIMLPYGGTAAPSGFFMCDGSAVSRTTFAALFAAIGTRFGTGDGSTTFNLPDMRSRFPVGAGTGSGLSPYTLGVAGGAEGTALVQANLPAATFDAQVNTANPSAGGNAAIQGTNDIASLSTVPGAVSSGGSATPVAIIPPYVALNWLIKT